MNSSQDESAHEDNPNPKYISERDRKTCMFSYMRPFLELCHGKTSVLVRSLPKIDPFLDSLSSSSKITTICLSVFHVLSIVLTCF